MLTIIGVRAWLARGYFIPGGTSQRGGGQAPAFRVARCRTRSLVDIRLGPVGSHQGSSETRMGPYLSRTPIRVHRVFHQGSPGAVGPYRPKSVFRRVSVRTPIWHDKPRQASTGHSTVPYRCTTKIRTPQGPYSSPRAPAAGRRHRRTPFHRSSRFGAPMRPSLLSA